MEAEALVSDYLGRLERAAQPLPADRRRGELIAEVHEHIESALAEAGSRDEVTARNVLERLGAPEEIVAAETGSGGEPAGRHPRRHRRARPALGADGAGRHPASSRSARSSCPWSGR